MTTIHAFLIYHVHQIFRHEIMTESSQTEPHLKLVCFNMTTPQLPVTNAWKCRKSGACPIPTSAQILHQHFEHQQQHNRGHRGQCQLAAAVFPHSCNNLQTVLLCFYKTRKLFFCWILASYNRPVTSPQATCWPKVSQHTLLCLWNM